MATRAQHYIKVEGGVQCKLCPHHCFIREKERGICQVRELRNGVLYSLSDGYVSSLAYDPLEKKPLLYFGRGDILSIGSFGCNFHCDFCQNYRLLEPEFPKIRLSDDYLLELARKRGSLGLAYTYNEPAVNFEMVKRLARKIHDQGQINVMVTNGYIEKAPREELLQLIDAWSIDFKMPKDLYPKICGARQEPVLETIKDAYSHSHVEVTILLIPGRNTQEYAFRKMLEELALIGEDIPLHLARYFPAYRCSIAATELETMFRAREIALEYLERVELGNMPISW